MYEIMLVVSAAVFVMVSIVYARSGLASIFHPLTIYLAFHGLVFVFRPILAYLGDYRLIYWIYGFAPSPSDKITALAAATLGLVCYATFAMRTGNIPMRFKDSAEHVVERKLLQRTLPIMLAICVPLGVYSLQRAFDGSVTGISTMVTKNGVRINTQNVGYISDAMLLLVPVCALVAWYFRFRLLALTPLLLFFLIKASTGGRGPFVVAALATALFYFYDRKVRIPGGKILALALVVGAFFSFVGQDRGYALREALGVRNEAEASTAMETRFLEGMDFANLEYMEYLVYVVPQRSGTYDFFLMNLQILTEPIPRVMWPGKPIGAPIKTIDIFDYGTPMGMTMSLPGAGWFQFGWAGVIFWCGLWGWGTGRFYKWFVNSRQDTLTVAAYITALPILIIAFRDGVLITVVRQALFYLMPVLLMLGLRRMFAIPGLDEIGLLLARRRKKASGTTAVTVQTRSQRRRADAQPKSR